MNTIKYLLNRSFSVLIVLCSLFAGLLSGCVSPQVDVSPTPPLPAQLVLYDWVNDVPERAIEAFSKEFGVQVIYRTYESQEEAVENIKAGNQYDVVVLDNRLIPPLIESGQLARLNHDNLPNLANFSDDFRDRPVDRGNHYSVPYNWGTTGLVVRSDLAPGVTRWKDLWGKNSTGKVVMWRGVPREMIGGVLKGLGYSANSESLFELEQAQAQLEKIRSNLIFAEDYGSDVETSSPILTLGNAVMAIGWSTDAIQGQAENPAITYVLPEEGALFWGDNFVVPANSSNQYAAELFINFLLRPEISALITNQNGYATGNEKAQRYISADVLKNPYIFPSIETVRRAETILPLSPEGEARYQAIWDRIIGGN